MDGPPRAGKDVLLNRYPTPSQPTAVCLIVTTACDRQCISCAVSVPYRKMWHVGLGNLREMGEQLGYVENLVVSGGEPTLHPCFEEVIDAVERYFSFGILCLATNGAKLLDYRHVWGKFNSIGVSLYPVHKSFGSIPSNEALVEKITSGLELTQNLPVWKTYSVPGKKTKIAILGPIEHNSQPIVGRWPVCRRLWKSVVVYDGRIYPCCALPIKAVGEPLSPGWRERWHSLVADCDHCLLPEKEE